MRIWTFPMNFCGWLLAKLSRCTPVPNADELGQPEWREYAARPGSLLHRWFCWQGFTALTPSANCIIWRDPAAINERTRSHELVHVFQHRQYGWFFLPVYGLASLLSQISGSGWYRGNFLEVEARQWEVNE